MSKPANRNSVDILQLSHTFFTASYQSSAETSRELEDAYKEAAEVLGTNELVLRSQNPRDISSLLDAAFQKSTLTPK